MQITIDGKFYSHLVDDAKILYCREIIKYKCVECPFNKKNHYFDADLCTELTDEQITIILKKIYAER